MNGAVTIGTLDGANVEILDAVGAENFFLFGLTVDEVAQAQMNYQPQTIVDGDRDFTRVMDLLTGDQFAGDDRGALDGVVRSILEPSDPWMTAADFRGFVDAQQRANDTYKDMDRWTAMSIRNSAASGRFSTDRTMREYNEDIWRLSPIELAGK